MTLEFDPVAHRYTFAGRAVPHVTGIIEGAQRFAGVPEAALERARARGTALHRAIELHLAGTLDEDTLGADTRACLDQFRRFQSQTGFVAVVSESRMYSARYGYAGTIDTAGRFPGRVDRVAVVDWKRASTLSPSVGLQLAAYKELLLERFPEMRKPVDRYALQLRPDAYKLVEYTDPGDWSVFAAALTLWRFCNVHKLN